MGLPYYQKVQQRFQSSIFPVGKVSGGFSISSVNPGYVELGPKGNQTIMMSGVNWTFVTSEPIFPINTTPWRQ